jgi:glycosyltransferase involved in cell wall biosynthesis
VGEGAVVLVDPSSPQSIAEGMAGVLGDRAEAERLSGAARTRAESFSWERTARLVQAAYDEVAS